MAALSSTNSRTTLTGLIIAVSMTTIDQTIVALSAPTIETDLGISHAATQWAVNIYLIATAAAFMLGGRLTDVIGHKRMTVIGIIAFGATSLLCGLAPTGQLAAPWLIAARALQGVAGAIMYPAAIGIVVQGFARESRAKAMAIFFGITGAMTAIGPIAGGYLSEWTWRSVFWVNVPLAVAAVIIVGISAENTPRRRERIDLVGALLIAIGLGGIVFGLQQAGAWGWTNGAVMLAMIGGASIVVAFVAFESRAAQPLVTLTVFRDRGFIIAALALFFASVAFLSTFFFLSVYGQVTLQLSSIETGELFFLFFIGFVVASQIGSRQFDRHGARGVLLLGGLLGVAGFAWLAIAVTHFSPSNGALFTAQTAPIILAGGGIGFMLSAASTDAVNRAIGSSYGEVTAISQTMRNFGGAVGIAVLSSIVTTHLTTTLTRSFVALGATPATAQAAVDGISGQRDNSPSAAAVPAAIRAQFTHAVQAGYAEAVAYAFAGSAAAMAVIVILALAYPKGQISSQRSTSPARETAPRARADDSNEPAN